MYFYISLVWNVLDAEHTKQISFLNLNKYKDDSHTAYFLINLEINIVCWPGNNLSCLTVFFQCVWSLVSKQWKAWKALKDILINWGMRFKTLARGLGLRVHPVQDIVKHWNSTGQFFRLALSRRIAGLS